MIDIHKKAFIEEATELLAGLEISLLELENTPDDYELIAKIFRGLHTIKGSSAMFGYDDITMFTHDIENVFDHIRNGEIPISKEIIDLTLLARDQISLMLTDESAIESGEGSDTHKILSAFRKIVNKLENGSTSKNNKAEEIVLSKTETDSKTQTFLISFKPESEIFLTGTNPALLLNELCELGECIVIPKESELPPLEYMNPEKCYLSWEIILKTNQGVDAIKDVFIFVEDSIELTISEIDSEGKLNNNEDFEDFGSLLVQLPKTNRAGILELLNAFESSVSVSKTSANNVSLLKSKSGPEVHHEKDSSTSLRVNAEKLDELVNLVGELVTVQARLSQLAQEKYDQDLVSVSEEVERITWSLRDSTLNIRMLPIGTTFSKFKRLLRDLSKELGKEVELTTDGAETELDKTVLEKLNDPLVHIIRNCIDHGIESPEERLLAGKDRCGWVQLSASQSGGSVLVEITDDGKGIDKEAVIAKAIKNGLIPENAELSDSEIYSLIFAPGFSTAKSVTNVSGRGVGMDVVKKAIENLRGTVEIISNKGAGTTIILKLPLTLAIIDGLLVKVDEDRYIIPLSAVEECIELTKADIDTVHGRHFINVRGKITPYINLREIFRINSERPEIEQIVIADINGTRLGFVVDKVFGQHQTVLKSLGSVYKSIEAVSGATILGDGTVALILDMRKLAEYQEIFEKKMILAGL